MRRLGSSAIATACTMTDTAKAALTDGWRYQSLEISKLAVGVAAVTAVATLGPEFISSA